MYLAFKAFGIVQALALCQGALDASIGRRLQTYEAIKSYTPTTPVTDLIAIDLDVHTIRHHLREGGISGYRNAERIYREGAYSRSVAELLTSDQLGDLGRAWVGMEVVGLSHVNGSEVKGALLEVDEVDSYRRLRVAYAPSEDQDENVGCHVGANPDPNFDGCFAEQGTLAIPDLELGVSYTYDVLANNLNLLSISKLSTRARKVMRECETCTFYPMYSKYVSYYGRFDYADHIILSAFHRDKTAMDRGNMDFTVYSEHGRSEIISKAITHMSIWMHVTREMEGALDHCWNSQGKQNAFELSTHGWDKAVAFYTGSRENANDDTGTLLYDIAERACSSMNTCLDGTSHGISFVNHYAFKQFESGQRHLASRECEKAHENKHNISLLMTIPLIQNAIRYAHMISREMTNGLLNEKHAAQGAVYALSVLPLIHHCNADDATIIYENLKPTKKPAVDFAAVKAAFERNYECLGIMCFEIGGVWDGNDYFGDAFPCVDNVSPPPAATKKEGKKDSYALLVVLILVGLLVAFLLLFLIYRTFKKSDVELDTAKEEDVTLPGVSSCPSEDESPVFNAEVI